MMKTASATRTIGQLLANQSMATMVKERCCNRAMLRRCPAIAAWMTRTSAGDGLPFVRLVCGLRCGEFGV